MKLDLFDYRLPRDLIAQKQIKPRDKSRLLILDKKIKKISHDFFYNLDKYLDNQVVLIFNDSKVIPARICFSNQEFFLLKELKPGEWEIMGRKLRIGKQKLKIKNVLLEIEITKRLTGGKWLAKFNYQGKKFREILDKIGQTPTPPYIKTIDSKRKKQDYQTIYARVEGSVAAPTAGFHFTRRIFNRLEKRGIQFEFVTLHVGLGTFAPVRTNKIEEHKIHSEYAILDKEVAKRLNNYKKQGKRIIAVGTTSARVLEALSNRKGQLKAGSRWINIFIYPGYKFKFVDSLITNFHLPKSTLLMLVSALAGRKLILRAYRMAIKRRYRFYSFGDGMLIW